MSYPIKRIFVCELPPAIDRVDHWANIESKGMWENLTSDTTSKLNNTPIYVNQMQHYIQDQFLPT